MTTSIVIFFVSLLVIFGLLIWSARQLALGKRQLNPRVVPDIAFRKIEKHMLYYTKNIVQITVITVVKYSMLATIKTKKTVREKWPHIHRKIKRALGKREPGEKPSFIQKAILESKTKIRRVKDRIKKEHAVKEQQEEEAQTKNPE